MANNKKMKIGLCIIFVAFLIIKLLLIVSYYSETTYSIITNSYRYEEDNIVYRLYKKNMTAEVIESPKANGKVTIPSYIISKNKRYAVTTIKSKAFLNNNNVVEINFSEGIKIIEDESISTNISKISIPNSIESFQVSSINVDNMETLSNCKYLGNDENPYVVLVDADKQVENIVLPEGLKVIGPSAFYASNITSIVLPDSVVSIERYAFKECASLSNLDISEDSYLEHIGEGSLTACVTLKSLFIPKNCTDIDIISVHYYSSSLEKIVVHNENSIYDSRNDCNAVVETKTNKLILGCKNTIIPESIKILGYKCFGGVVFDNTEIILPNTIREIGAYAFNMCNASKIILNESCEKLGPGAFEMCSKLEELIINKNIKEIGYGICEYDSKLEKLVIPFIGENVNSKKNLSYFFGGLSGTDFPNLSIYISPKKEYIIRKNSIDISCNEIYFLENVCEIKSKAFKIKKINNIYISYSVTKVGKNIMDSYYDVSNLTIYIEAMNLGKKWNINWNNINNAKLEYGYSFEQIYQEMENY